MLISGGWYRVRTCDPYRVKGTPATVPLQLHCNGATNLAHSLELAKPWCSAAKGSNGGSFNIAIRFFHPLNTTQIIELSR
jgi:hypothetical protein